MIELVRDSTYGGGTITLHDRIYGTLGLIKVGNDTFLAVVTRTSAVFSTVLQGVGAEPRARIMSVEFISLSDSSHDGTSQAPLEGIDVYTSEVTSRASELANRGDTVLEHPCTGIRKILGNGSFYYSQGGGSDITTRLQARLVRAQERRGPASEREDSTSESSSFDARFLWNRFLASPLLDFRTSLTNEEQHILDSDFLILAMQGFVGAKEVRLGDETALLSVISRLGSDRAGTRFNTRGIDDAGNVANFVEVSTFARSLFAYPLMPVHLTRQRLYYALPPCACRTLGASTYSCRLPTDRPRVDQFCAGAREFARFLGRVRRTTIWSQD